jgi:hypothetical protein
MLSIIKTDIEGDVHHFMVEKTVKDHHFRCLENNIIELFLF